MRRGIGQVITYYFPPKKIYRVCVISTDNLGGYDTGSTSLIWKRLLLQNKKITTTDEIVELASNLGKDGVRSVHYLQEEGYICRIFRGIFYVKSIEERELGTLNTSIYKIVARGLEKKGVKNWYFCLETALKMNSLTHEYFTIDYIYSETYRSTKVIRIIDSSFKAYKKCGKYFRNGIITKNGIRYSDPEKTVLDLVHRMLLDSNDKNRVLSIIAEYRKMIDIDILHGYLDIYPRKMKQLLRGAI